MINIEYIHFDTLPSTNTWVKKHAHELNQDGLTCITAKEQTAGRGRFKRSWVSPKGNLYATVFFTIPPHSSYLSNIGQILAYSCAVFFQKEGIPIQIKWPNDLLIQKKKVGGILTETIQLPDKIGIVLGLGINLQLTDKEISAISQPVTSLAAFSNKCYIPGDVLPPIVEVFLKNLQILEEKGFAVFQKSFDDFLAYKGEEIVLNIGNERVTGTCQGVAADGRLQVLLPEGEQLLFWSGRE